MVASAEPMTTITVRVPASLRDRYGALAKSTDRNRRYSALEALRRYLESET